MTTPTKAERDELGKIVRDEWVRCKQEEVSAGTPVKSDHLLPWEYLPEREREIDRRIGEAVAGPYLRRAETAEAERDKQKYLRKWDAEAADRHRKVIEAERDKLSAILTDTQNERDRLAVLVRELQAAADTLPNRRNFGDELTVLLNKYSKENGSNTPDFILAEYLMQQLDAWNLAVRAREEWYGRKFSHGSPGNAAAPQELKP